MSYSTVLFTFGIIGGAAIIFIILERIYPYDKEQKIIRDGFWNDLLLYTILQSYFIGLLISFLIDTIDHSTGLSRLGIISGLPISAQVAFFVITHDFYIYWFHRFCHKNIYLWRLHEAHHSTTDVDWLSGARSHSLEILINQTVEYAPIILLGAAPEVAVIKGVISSIWGMFIHSNININSANFLLKYIINTPGMHRWHHSIIVMDGENNYATKFAFWDWLFGTAYFPENGKKPSAYGIAEIDFPKNYIMQHIFAFRPLDEIDRRGIK